MWSCILGGLGLAAPVIVPPVRDAFGFGRVAPVIVAPPVKALIEQSSKKL